MQRRDFIRLSAGGAIALAAVRLAGMPALRHGERAAEPLDLARWLQPVPPQAFFREPGWHVWCGSMIRDAAGRCHLFYSRWRAGHGFFAWVTHSEVAHAVADHPLGPYRPVDVALPARGGQFWDGHCTHNPTVIEADGRCYLYYMGNRGDRRPTAGLNWSHRNNQRIGVAVADSPDGPWTRFDQPLIEGEPGCADALCCANPAVMRRPGGGFLMVYKAVAQERPLPFGGPVRHLAAVGATPLGPFEKNRTPVFTVAGVDFPAEDPCLWWQDGRYRAIVKDMKGDFTHAGRSLALMESADGLDWQPSAHVLVSPTALRLGDGSILGLHALERPQLWLERGEPAVLFCAASTARQPGGPETFNVAIPLRRPD